ncbi:dihydrouridine synthase domain containing protein [Aphelenchoides avenae]|nr:dihydrouridine synthase domain containing protein [Aphelenchus avenae]
MDEPVARRMGYAPIKTEFLMPVKQSISVADVMADCSLEAQQPKDGDVEATSANCDAAPPAEAIANGDAKRLPPTEKRKQRHRGMDRQREQKMAKARHEVRLNSVRLCPSMLIPGRKCKFGENCNAEHSVEAYMKGKEDDIGPECVRFEQAGTCQFSVSCRYAKAHSNEDYTQVTKEPHPSYQPELNTHSMHIQVALRKKQFDFSRSEQALSALPSHTGAMEREPVRLDMRMFAGKPYLAPLTTVGNLPFRRLCVELGAEITCGEMAMATALLQGQPKEWSLVKRHPSEKIFGVQIAGGYPDTLTKTAQMLVDETSIDFIDLNLGCPLDMVNDKGGGCGLAFKSNRLIPVLKGMSQVMKDVPLTIKMRYGMREAEWDYVQECADAIQGKAPLWACGDVLSYEDYYQRLDNHPISGIMIGRGALIKPWLFTEIKERRYWDITATERLEIIKKYANFGLEHWGTDDPGVNTTRRFLLEWLSFQYRYVPVGLLEVLPPKINDKPPAFRGRNEMETLLASPASSDWVKITEIFLGKAPDGFLFVPKHNANAY